MIEKRVIQNLPYTNVELLALNPKLLAGQDVVVKEIHDALNMNRKIGDGVSVYTELPFIDIVMFNATVEDTVIDLNVDYLSIAGTKVSIQNSSVGNVTVAYNSESYTLAPNETKRYDFMTIWTDYGTVSTNTLSAGPAVRKSNGVIIPLYVYPSDIRNNVEWNNVMDVKKKYPEIPTIAIVNPANGAGTVVDGNYTVGIKRLQNANIKVVGYVSTSYGNRDINLVKADIDSWLSLYGIVDGIFFDEVDYAATTVTAPYYRELDAYAKARALEITVGNCGSPFNTRYFEEGTFDVIIGWENSSYPTDAQAEENYADGASEYNYLKRALLVHSQASFDATVFKALAAKYYGWVYITDDIMPNPWDQVTTFLESMYSALQAIVTATLSPIVKTDFSDRTLLPVTSELILDQSPSIVTSKGTSPIEGMGLGNYIPKKIEIDKVWYANPQGGQWAFFEPWVNESLTERSDWSEWSAATMLFEKVGDWTKFTTTVAGPSSVNTCLGTSIKYSATDYAVGCLFKKGNRDVFSIGFSGGTTTYAWSTDTLTVGSTIGGHYRLSDDLVYIYFQGYTASSYSLRIYPGIADTSVGATIQFKGLQLSKIAFIPPMGQDGNSIQPNRAYPFTDWDKPISFKLKLQLGAVPTENAWVISDSQANGASVGIYLTKYGRIGVLLSYGGGSATIYVGYTGTVFDGGTTNTGDATAIVDYLSVPEMAITYYRDTTNNEFNLWVNNQHIVNGFAVTLSETNQTLSIGDLPLYSIERDYSAKSYISNLAVHDVSATLPIDQSKPFYNPETQYGLDDARMADKFGNETFRTIQALAGGADIEEIGENVNGSYILYSNGFKVMWGNQSKDNGAVSSQLFSFPISFTVSPALAITPRSASYVDRPVLYDVPSTEEYRVLVLDGNNAQQADIRDFSFIAIGF